MDPLHYYLDLGFVALHLDGQFWVLTSRYLVGLPGDLGRRGPLFDLYPDWCHRLLALLGTVPCLGSLAPTESFFNLIRCAFRSPLGACME